MLTIVAALAIAATSHARLVCTKPGVRLWNLKSNIPKPSSITKAPLIPLKDLMAMPYPDVMPKSNLNRRDRVAAFPNPHNLTEGQMVRTRGWLRLVATEDNDCEYHMQLTLSRTSKRSFIVEVSKDDATSIHSAFVRSHAKTVRAFVRSTLFNGDEPPEDAKALDDPVYVEVVGQLFLDSAHSVNGQRGKAGMPAATLWELHPVLAIKRAPEP